MTTTSRARWAVVRLLAIAPILAFAACGSPQAELEKGTGASVSVSPSSTPTNSARGTEFVPAPAAVPTATPAIWRNGTARCPMPPHVTVPPNGAARGDATKGFCIVWSSDFPDESGFRVLVSYGGGEVFSHTVGPDEHDFIFPPEEAPVLTGPGCSRRKDFTMTVFVIRPRGEEPIGGMATVAECGPR